MSHAADAQSAVAELVANVSTVFEKARAMPKSVYTSEALAELETRKIFAREWICVGRSSSLENPGDYLTLSLAGEPLSLIHI